MDFYLQLDTEPVGRVGASEPLCCEPQVACDVVMRRLREFNNGSILICDGGKLTGIFTERDAIKLMASDADLSRPISSVMTKDPVCISVGSSVGTAIQKMNQGGYRRLPVVDDRQAPVSVIKASHILHYLVEHFPRYIYNIPPRPHQAQEHREGA